jgi:hypothetical protein
MMRQFRQGDVLLCAVDDIPVTAMPVSSDGDRVIVALGELTGHAHVFAAHEARLFRDEPNGSQFPKVGPRSFMRSTTRSKFRRVITKSDGNESTHPGGRGASRIKPDAQRAALSGRARPYPRVRREMDGDRVFDCTH